MKLFFFTPRHSSKSTRKQFLSFYLRVLLRIVKRNQPPLSLSLLYLSFLRHFVSIPSSHIQTQNNESGILRSQKNLKINREIYGYLKKWPRLRSPAPKSKLGWIDLPSFNDSAFCNPVPNINQVFDMRHFLTGFVPMDYQVISWSKLMKWHFIFIRY